MKAYILCFYDDDARMHVPNIYEVFSTKEKAEASKKEWLASGKKTEEEGKFAGDWYSEDGIEIDEVIIH